jgi:hypothetical protein
MTEYRPSTAWLRLLAGLLALAGALGLAGCGGGSGAPNNVFNTPGALTLLPGPTVVAYSGQPTVLTISGGQPPYRAFSSNSGILPVAQAVSGSSIVLLPANVTGDTDVIITAQDTPPGATAASVAVTVTVRAAPLLNSLTITPNNTECGTTAICSGQDGTATVTVLGPQGGPIAGRAIRFDVVSGPFLITTTNPGQPLVTSLTVVSDANGVASVIIKANAGAPTQFAQLRATDLTSGQQLTGTFLIQQVIDGSKILTVVPPDATITGAFKGQCSTNFVIDYFIYGGTPPYRVTSTFPTGIALFNPIVTMEGGFFEALTNGTCLDPLTFSIVDATGRQTTALLHNVEGTTAVPVPPTPTSPVTATLQKPGSGTCLGKTYSVLVSGGTAPYNPTASPPGVVFTPPAPAAPGFVSISGLIDGTTYSFAVGDASTPAQVSPTFKITCPVP